MFVSLSVTVVYVFFWLVAGRIIAEALYNSDRKNIRGRKKHWIESHAAGGYLLLGLLFALAWPAIAIVYIFIKLGHANNSKFLNWWTGAAAVRAKEKRQNAIKFNQQRVAELEKHLDIPNLGPKENKP